MADEGFKRKLAAILSADVEGYSRLMDDDEEATVRTLTTYRTAIKDLVQQYRGRIVDTPGDNALAEFTSVVDAVNCAVEIQRELAEKNAELPYNRKMEFRIGINLGDVIEEEDRIYGDGINIAARVESMADAGGICISGRAFDQVANKLGLEYENLGEHQVKNISTPIRVYRVLSFPGAAAHRVVQAKDALRRRWRKIALPIAGAVIAAIVVLGVWQFYVRRPTVEPASIDKMAFTLPDKPSIAVLPFDNMSGDPEQDYIADGFTENIITGLSQIPQMFVIARNSVFTYKGKPVKVKQVSEELGVKYVLEGSIQMTGDRLRASAQLIDALTGHHLWAKRYDRDLKQIFALQDEITMKIITALQVKLTEGEQARLRGKGTDNLGAYLKALQAWVYFIRLNKEDNALGRKMFEKAIELDPEYAVACTGMAWTYWIDLIFGWSESPVKSIDRAYELAQKALALDPSLPDTHSLLGSIYSVKNQHEKAIAECEKAITLSPSGADNYHTLADNLIYAGRPEEAIPFSKKAIRLNPFPPGMYLGTLGQAYFFLGRHEEAVAVFEKYKNRESDSLYPWMGLACNYSMLGREREARAAAAEVLRLYPAFSAEYHAMAMPYKNQAYKDRFLEAMRNAGLPE
jgi:TolB-like protein/class 3 adenylate cyclase